MLRSLPERQALNYAAAATARIGPDSVAGQTRRQAIRLALDGLIRSRALVLDEMAARQSAGRARESAGSFGCAYVRAAAACQPRGARARPDVAGSIHRAAMKTRVAKARSRNRRWRNEALSSGRSAARAQIGLDGSDGAPGRQRSCRSFATTGPSSADRRRSPTEAHRASSARRRPFLSCVRAPTRPATRRCSVGFGCGPSTRWCPSGGRTSPPRDCHRRKAARRVGPLAPRLGVGVAQAGLGPPDGLSWVMRTECSSCRMVR